MLKEVQTNGQISLGPQFAGRRYDLRFHADGRVELLPVNESAAEGTEPTSGWAQENADAIAQYNAWAITREPYSQRVRRWREARRA